MRDYKTNVISFQSRESSEKSTETDFTITLKSPMAAMLRAIARAEGTDPDCQVMLALVHLMNQKWNFKENKPKERGCST